MSDKLDILINEDVEVDGEILDSMRYILAHGRSSFPAYELVKFLAKTGNTAAQFHIKNVPTWPGHFVGKFEHIPPPVIRKLSDE